MKIGILTLHSQTNYGGVLQAFALQQAILKMGHDVEIVDYWLSRHNTSLKGPRPSLHVLKDMARDLVKRRVNAFDLMQFNRRYRKTFTFNKKHLKTSPRHFQSADDLEQNLCGYDVVVVGSDQVWNYKWFGNPNPFVLSRWDKNSKLISYASSFGFDSLPDQYRATYQKGLAEFDRISIRESSNVPLAQSLSGKDMIEVVADPTLLLDKAEWMHLIRRTVSQNQYLLIYWLGNPNMLICSVTKLRTETDIRIVCLGGDNLLSRSASKTLKKLGVFVKFSASPEDFLNLIAQADYVFSDSFHAFMFSIIFEKKCFIVVDSGSGRSSMALRMKDFVEICGSEECIHPSVKDLDLARFCRPSTPGLGAFLSKSKHYLSVSLGEKTKTGV